MKKISIILAVLFLIPLVFAELELEEIKIYINDGDSDERIISHMEDKDESDEIYLNRGDKISIKVELDNDMDNDTQYYLEGDIDYIGDERFPGDGWETIEQDKYEAQFLDFGTVPNDMPYNDNYDFDFKIRYRYANETEDEWVYEWEVIIEKDGDRTEEIELEDVMRNLSITCSNVIWQMTETFDYIDKYDDVSTNLSSCREERGTYKSQADEKEITLIRCQTDRDGNKDDFDECDDKKKQMISTSECKTQENDAIRIAVDEAEKKKDNTMIGVGVAGLGLWWFVYKRKKGSTVHSKFYQEKIIP